MKAAVTAADRRLTPERSAELRELMTWARAQLGLDNERPWKLISARSKLKKIFFEVEESGAGGTVRLIGKLSRSDRGAGAFDSLRAVWEAGFCPPSPYTVVRPVAYFAERKLLLQEKAPGVQLLEYIRRNDSSVESMTRRAARWLAALHGARLDGDPFDGEAAIAERCLAELPAELRESADRIRVIAGCLVQKLQAREAPQKVPSHGDFHPLNVFLAPERVTVIDFDTFSRREPAADVAYFLSQSAIMGYLDRGEFDSTEHVRAALLEEYETATGSSLDRKRLGVYIALAFLQSLHFEMCILHTGNQRIAEPWLRSAERCLEGGIGL